MKTYYDFTDEISQVEIYEGLLGYGLFSEKLPPILTSESFLSYCLNQSPTFHDKPRLYVFYESMRNTNVPRQLGIPNPMAYQLLCKCISDNWKSIQDYIRQKVQGQSYIASRVHLRKTDGSKVLFRMNYGNWRTDGTPEPDLLIGSRYIVRADISTCFPSIYTHSIPWALIGKETAKQKRAKTEWFNQLDHYIQNCKYGETHGILIGPHTSNLISEIILLCIDYEISATQKWRYIRHVDDYTCFVNTHEEAQLFLTELSGALRRFDLALNHKKTEISELPMAMTEQWVRQVDNPAIYYRNGIMDYISVRSYLDSTIEIMQKNGENSAILNYAIKALPASNMTKNAIEYCIKTIFHLCLLYPYLFQILDEFVLERFHVPIEQIKSFTQLVYKQELHRRNYDGVCYSIFFALKYGFMINELQAQDAIESDSCLFKLLAFLYYRKNRVVSERALMHSHATELKKDPVEFGQNWLFVYEALPQSELTDDWKTIKLAGVSFLRKEYQV